MNREDYGTIVEIGDILVSEDVIFEFFACDYPVCKGKCCIVGDSGAPLKEVLLSHDITPLFNQANPGTSTKPGSAGICCTSVYH